MSGLKLRKRKDSSVLHIEGVYNGRRVRQSTGTADKALAEVMLADMVSKCREEQLRGGYKDVTFGEVAVKHLPMLTKKSANKDFEYVKKLRPFIGGIMMSELVRPKEVDMTRPIYPLNKYVAKRAKDGVTGNTINKELSLINTMGRKAIVEYNLLSKKVWENIRLLDDSEKQRLKLKPSVSKHHLESEWERELLSYLPDHLCDMAVFSIHTGQRESVVCNLQWDWYKNDGDIYYFQVPREYMKSERHMIEDAYVVLNETAQDIIDSQGKVSSYVFTHNGMPIKTINSTAYQTARMQATEAFPEIANTDVHSFKRTFVTRLYDAGVPHDWVQRLSNHKLTEVTEKYNKMNPTKRAKMYEYLSLLD
jgi:integrase